MTSATNAPASNTCMTDLPNDMWLAVAGKLLKNLDILTAHPTRQSLASLIGLSVHEPGYGSSDYERIWMTDTVELWSPITDDGVRMTPGELIVEFMDLISDRNSQTGNPYLYVMPLPGMVVIDRQRRRVSARVEYVSKSKLRSSNETSDR